MAKINNVKEEFDNWSDDDKFGVWSDYFDLVKKLHNNMDLIPKKVKDEIWDLVYSHYEP